MWKLIFAQLVAKNPGVSKSVLELLAKKLAEKVTEESQIEGAITEFEANSPLSIKDYADFVQQQGDARVGEAKKKWDSEKPKPKENDQPDKTIEEEDKNAMPAWAKALQQSVTSLGQQFAEKKTESTLSELVAKAKEKGIPEAYARKHSVGEDFSMDEALSALETEWTEIKQAAINTQVAGEQIVSGMKTTGKQVSSAIANFAKANVEASATKN